MHRIIQLLLLIFIVPASLLAQLSQLQIKDKPEKMATPIPEVRDINGRICAAIQVISEMEGFKYDSYQGVVKVIDLRGKDMVFLSPDERVLEIYHSGYQPLKIILAGIGMRLEGKQGWKITLTGEKKLVQIPVVIETYPDSVTVTIDDNNYGFGKLFMIANGHHRIQISKEGFATITDSIKVDKDNRQFKFVLAPQLEMVFVKGGAFQMVWEGVYEKYEKLVPVQVKVNDFFIGKYEVTFAAYDAFCEDTGKAKPNDMGWGRGKRPVFRVTWYDAVEFSNWISKKHGFLPCYHIDRKNKDQNNKSKSDELKWIITRNYNANGYRLPTEAEWEYACMGGGQVFPSGQVFPTEYSGSDNYDEVGWCASNSDDRTHPVGEKRPNELGIYDMSGNVKEWCADWFGEDYYLKSPQEDPAGPSNGEYRVLRGGSCSSDAVEMRCTRRENEIPVILFNFYVGFRCVRSAH